MREDGVRDGPGKAERGVLDAEGCGRPDRNGRGVVSEGGNGPGLT